MSAPAPLFVPEPGSVRRLSLESYPQGAPVGWDNAAYFFTVDLFAVMRDTFVVKLTGGATYYFFSMSDRDPGTLALHDSDGKALAWDTDQPGVDPGTDAILAYRATYTGDHYIDADWTHPVFNVVSSIEVYEDVDTVDLDSTVYGTAGNDVLRGGAPSQRFEGGPGRDAFQAPDIGLRSAVVEPRAGGEILVRHGRHTETLAGIEEVRFADGRLVFDQSHAAAQVVRLYEAALDRLPDQAGLNFWIDAVQNGRPLSELAQGFLGSGEFRARFGDVADNGAFVDRLYQNVLGRAGETGGRDFWVGSLNAGTGRAEVLVAFSDGPENKAGTAALVQSGIWDRSEAAAEVARMYDSVFGRLPDVQGLSFWKNGLESGAATKAQMADAFTGSAEFRALYGALGNRDFADALYRNTLDRPSDGAGLDHWTRALDSGAATRAEVVLAFSEGAEHVALTAKNIQSEDPGEFGILFA